MSKIPLKLTECTDPKPGCYMTILCDEAAKDSNTCKTCGNLRCGICEHRSLFMNIDTIRMARDWLTQRLVELHVEEPPHA
jgi:hypothetical protein